MILLVAALAWHPVHESLFASGGSDGSLMFWIVGSVSPLDCSCLNIVCNMLCILCVCAIYLVPTTFVGGFQSLCGAEVYSLVG